MKTNIDNKDGIMNNEDIEENSTIDEVIPNPMIEKNLEFIKNNQHLHYERFDSYSRFLHVLVVVSFLSLAITGMIIKFSGVGVFQSLSKFVGGYEVTGFIHRFAAIITFVYFFLHIFYLIRKTNRQKKSFAEMAFGNHSLFPGKIDAIQFIQTIKWFIGMGKRPHYGRWTYWEKFDYLSVFWGIAVIGSSGLFLWFPEFFTSIGIPGSLINIATIIHSDEALLAVGFIFTIHFYNTHFRPDKFPMDTVIFTGKVEIEELKYDRPGEYEELLEKENIKEYLKPDATIFFTKVAKVFGTIALLIGMSIIIMIIYSMLFLYQ